MRCGPLLVIVVMALCPSCGAIREGNAKSDIREELGCPDAEVRQMGWSRRLVAEGCGRRAVYYCARQWVACVEISEVVKRRVATESGCDATRLSVTELEVATFMTEGCGGRAVHRCTIGASGNVRCDIQQPWTGAPSSSELTQPRPSTAPGVVSADPTPEVRAWLDSHRAAILGCAGRDTVVVRLTRDSDGALAVSLQPPLAGTPEEACVREAIGSGPSDIDLRGTVIHAVR